MNVATVKLRHKATGKVIIVNATDYGTDLGQSKYAGYSLVGESHRGDTTGIAKVDAGPAVKIDPEVTIEPPPKVEEPAPVEAELDPVDLMDVEDDADEDSVLDLLDNNVEVIKDALPDMDIDDLMALYEAESDGKTRIGVTAAIEREIESREAE